MAGTIRAREAASLRRDAILEAVAFAAERLLLTPDWRSAADDVLARLGLAADVSRAYIEVNDERGGRLVVNQLAEWVMPGVATHLDDPALLDFDWIEGGFGRWEGLLRRGNVIQGPVRSMSEHERPILEAQGILSLIAFPVFVGSEWWGVIGLDDCETEREWSGAEVEALRAAAGVLGAAIKRQLSDRQALELASRYQEFVDHIPAVTYTDVPGPGGASLGYLSDQIEQLLGYPRERFLQDPDFWFEIVHPNDRSYIEACALSAGRGEQAFDQEYRMVAADGRIVWVHDTSHPILDERGALRHWQGFLVDVTERKDAEKNLRESEDRYRSLVDHSPDAILVHAEGKFVYANPAAAELLGAGTPGALIGMPILEIVHPDFHEVVRARVHEETEGHFAPALQERFLRLDGQEIDVEVEGIPIAYEGRPAGQIVVRDVTERLKAEEHLREAESRYRNFVENIPAVTYTDLPGPDADGDILRIGFMGPQVEQILGYPPERFLSEPRLWFDLIHPEDARRLRGTNAFDPADRTPFDEEYRMTAADGREVWVHDTSVPIEDDDGNLLYWQGFMVDITDRAHTEQRLRDAEERYRILVERLPAVLYTEEVEPGTSRPVRVGYMSPKVEELLGYPPERWTGITDFYLEIMNDDDSERTIAAVERSGNEGVPLDVDYRMRHADGRWVWVHEEAVLVRDLRDGPMYWQGFMIDVTERKEAEERLRDAEERYRILVERIPAVVYVEASDGETVLYMSPQVESVLGYTPEEWTSHPNFWADRIHPLDKEWVIGADRLATTLEPFSAEYRFRTADGRWLWIHDEATFVEMPQASGIWQGFLIDITESKAAEERIHQGLEHVRLIVETSLDALVTMDADGLIIGWNPQAESTFGWAHDEILGRSLAQTIIPERYREAHLEGLRRYKESGNGPVLNSRMEITALHREGHEFPVELSIAPVSVHGGTIFSAFVRDISDRKRAQEELERALEVERDAAHRLRALDEMKNTFLQAVSHDLRTPLAAILGLAVTLERGDVQLDERDSRDLASRIAGNARKLDRLVMNLLDLDRLGRGIIEPKLNQTDVGALVRRLLAESELIGGSRMHTDVQPVVIGVDGAKVERIVENLLANTARHTPANAQIWVSVRPHDGGALLLIEDDGPGVAAELRETIFEPFQQGPDAPQHSPGVGVGLTLVKRFAELHGGRAWVEERTGGGASFRVWLPDGDSAGLR